MNTRRSRILLTLLVLACMSSGCTTYKTNSTTKFKSVHLSGQEPVLHVGKIQETPDKLSLLGWVDARVTQPNWFSDAPTEAMANIILAEKGEKLGADAIIYTTYKTSKTSMFNTRIEARGQAVRLKDRSARLEGVAPRRSILTPEQPATPITTQETVATAEHPEATATTVTGAGDTSPDTIESPAAIETQAAVPAAAMNHDENLPTTVEEIARIKSPTQKAETSPVSLKQQVVVIDRQREAERQKKMAEKALTCQPDINDVIEYESRLESVEYMLMNAEFLQNEARSGNNRDLESAATRLVQMLELHRANLKREKPVVMP